MRINFLIFCSLFLVLVALFTNCETDPSICKSINYSEKFEVTKGQVYCFDDGQSFTVNRFDNQFCPCKQVCIWEGELLIEMILNDGQSLTDYTFHSSGKVESGAPPNGWKIELAEPAGDGCSDIVSAVLVITK